MCNKSIVSFIAILPQCDILMTLSSLITVKIYIMVFTKCTCTPLSPHLISMLDHHHSSRIECNNYSRKYNYILIRFDINYSQIVFPPGCENLSLKTGEKNYYDFVETKTLQFNSYNTKASFTMKPYRYNVNEKSFPIKYLIPSISVYKKMIREI